MGKLVAAALPMKAGTATSAVLRHGATSSAPSAAATAKSANSGGGGAASDSLGGEKEVSNVVFAVRGHALCWM